MASPAFAQTDWARYKTFANTRCESPKTIADMIEAAKGFPVFRRLNRLTVISSKTVETTPSFLECRVKLSVVGKGRQTFTGGLFTVHLFPGGQWNARFDPTY